MRKFLPFLFLSLLLCSCTNFNKVTQTKIDIPQDDIEKYTLNYEFKTQLSNLEPETEILYGFYTTLNEESTIKDFEINNNINANHYVYEYVLGTTFSDDFMLECIANKKTAYIKVIPSKYNMYKISEIYKLKNILKSYDTECYIELFPSPSQSDYNKDKYIKYFEESSKILKNSLTNCAIIFTPNISELFSSNEYYPSLESYDFVGFDYIGYVDENGYNNFFNKFNYVYLENYMDKPIFITTFAVSYFSDNYNTYYVNENIEYVNSLFKEIEENYYRVKGINFYNVDARKGFFSNKKYNSDNYSITENEKILKNTNRLLRNNNFTNDYKTTNKNQNEKFIYDAICVNDKYYVKEDILENKYLSKMNYSDAMNSYIFEDTKYIEIEPLFENDEKHSININNEKNTIYIKQK